MSDNPLTVTCTVRFEREKKGRKTVREGAEPKVEPGRTPRVSKLMALAIRYERLVRDGDIESYARIAELGYVSRARMTQIMNLRNLAPDIQEQILFLPKVFRGKDPIVIRHLLRLCLMPCWDRQRCFWNRLRKLHNQ